MKLDVALLSRLQFGFTISFHILFPAFSIGLAAFISIMEGTWLKTQNPLYLNISQFWTKVFALTFGMGVVSGLVMEFQLGTNWSGFTKSVGGVLGPLFTYEVMTAFFVEAGFLGVMLFGWKRVSPGLHYFATLLVLIGTTLSAYWIMSANTWMQHPIGYQYQNGIMKVTDWWQIVFNPLTLPRFIHMMLASYVSAAFAIASVAAFYLLHNQFNAFAKKCFSFIWLSLIILVPTQIFFGDMVGVNVHETQPLKTAAMEGIWETQSGAPLLLFALPDQEKKMNHFEIGIPHGAALINTHQFNGVLIGVNSVPSTDQPNVLPIFFSFRLMVGIGLVMLLLCAIAFYLRIKSRLYDTPWFLKVSLFSAPLGFIALWSGWITTEVGRQPWAVYHLIRTSDALSNLSVKSVMISFGLIFIVYVIIFGCFYTYFLYNIIKKGPANLTKEPAHQPFQYMPSTDLEKR